MRSTRKINESWPNENPEAKGKTSEVDPLCLGICGPGI